MAALTIVKGTNQALSLGDISGAGFWMILQYDATNNNWVLLNPATGLSNSIGVGQTWKTGAGLPSRALGVTYTNTSSLPIMVAVSVYVSVSSTSSSSQFYINGVVMAYGYESNNVGTDQNSHFFYFIVPPGASYKCAAGALLQWSEMS